MAPLRGPTKRRNGFEVKCLFAIDAIAAVYGADAGRKGKERLGAASIDAGFKSNMRGKPRSYSPASG